MLLSGMLSVSFYPDVHAQKPPLRPRIKRKKAAGQRRRGHYAYVRSHDFNNDGIVDLKDRLIWAERHKDNADGVYVADDNKDLAEAMDLNGDGNVTQKEMSIFYASYDINGNGVLEDIEIENATE